MNETTYDNGFETNQPKNNYKAEGDEIIKNLKSSEMFCFQFFFDSIIIGKDGEKKKKACQIAPLRSKMIYDLKREYNVNVTPEDFSSIVYLALWGDGTWKTLDSFQGRCSFFAWLRKVAKNAIMERLVDEHLIEDKRSRSVGNTRLAMLSQDPCKCKMVIDTLMIGSKYYGLLTSIYVDRLPEEDILKRQQMNADEYVAAKKAGESKLKDAMLRSEEFSEDSILRDKTKHVVMVSSEFVADLAEWYREKTDMSPFSDVFGTGLSEEELRIKTIDFLYEFSANLNWSDEDRFIWRQRFIENAPPMDLAKELGRSRGWLDTRYSRLNKFFNNAIKKWWNSHT